VLGLLALQQRDLIVAGCHLMSCVFLKSAYFYEFRCFTAVVEYIGCLGALWPGGVMVRALARDAKGRRFDSRPIHFQVSKAHAGWMRTVYYCCRCV